MIIIMTIVMTMIIIMIMTIIIIVSIIIIIINISVSRAPLPAQLGAKPAPVSCMNGNVQFTITITDARSPYINHSASGGPFCLSSHGHL